MSAEIKPAALRVELALRGWTQGDLAEKAGISRPTANAAVQGKPVSARTARAIGMALLLNKPVEGLAELVQRHVAS